MELSRHYRLSDAFSKFYESLNMGHFSRERGGSNHLSARALAVPGLEQGHPMRTPGHRGLWRGGMWLKCSCWPPGRQKQRAFNTRPRTRQASSTLWPGALIWGWGCKSDTAPAAINAQQAKGPWPGEDCASRPSSLGWVAPPACDGQIARLAPNSSLPFGSALPHRP